ncbi:MAG: hypothetical protein JRN21_08835 [Nitrososphaerota archaeon]|nr:hypothetical protein [Nitrososphaerota archaeon]
MQLSLLKFIIRTRYSRPFLILMAVLLVYYVGVSRAIPAQTGGIILSYYGTAIIALFLAMALATGGVMVLKSDRDYLFTLPLSTRDLSASIFFSQFITFGVTILLMFGYFYESFHSALILVDLMALALTATSLGVIAPAMTARVRAGLSAALAIWTLFAFTGFPLTPGSAFNGNILGGTATLVALAVVTTASAFRGLSRIELDMMRSLVRSTSTDVKSPTSYAGTSPIGAIYSMNLSSISLAGRMNMAGSSRYVSRRVRLRWVIITTCAAAAAYFVFVFFYTGSPQPFTGGSDSVPAAIGVSIALAFLSFFLSQSAITNERIWLSLTSLPAATYFRHLIMSRVASLMLILVPFAVADAALYMLGHGEALGALAVVVAVVPGSFVLEILWAAYVAPIQVKGDDLTMAAQFSIRQTSTVLPFVAVFILVSIATVLPAIAFEGGAILIMLAAAITMSGRFWGKVVTRLTETGFV